MKRIQAKQITDQKMLEVIHKVQVRMQEEKRLWGTDNYWATKPTDEVWASLMWIDEELPDFPPKVILAKLKGMVKRGLIHGCTCGCRGDFYPYRSVE